MQDVFLRKAKDSVCKIVGINPDDLYIVWFAKTLQNWKAIVSTDVESGLLFEVTYNGDKKETYVDVYKKHLNTAIVD